MRKGRAERKSDEQEGDRIKTDSSDIRGSQSMQGEIAIITKFRGESDQEVMSVRLNKTQFIVS